MRLRVALAALVLICPGWSLEAQESDATKVMTRLRAKFEEVGAFSARFRQTLDADYTNSSSTIEGTIILSGDKYRIETSGQTIVTDGETTWVYIVEDQQVIINDFVEDEGSFSPGHFLNDQTERYDVSFAEVQSPETYVVLLEATSPDTYLESATLWIDQSAYTVSRIDVVDVNGASIRFEMSEIDLSVDPDDSTFTYEPTNEVEVVDLR
jgi:outer membrane lipoprotein carrier protein